MRKASLVLAALALAALAAPVQTATASPPPKFGAAELSSAKSTIDARLRRPPAGVTSWGVDPASGRVTVSVMASDATALAAAKNAVAGLPAATITTVTERPRPYYNLVGGQAIVSGNGRCSIGFSARDSSNRTFVLTAGHCTAELPGTWTGYNGVTLGTAQAKNFPTDDFGDILVTNSSWVPTAQVQGGTSVAGSVEAAVGASVCRSGSTTGYHCGGIQAKNQTVNYGGGDVVYGLTKTTVCAEPGDSGGSWISGNQAQGMTSGGSGNCSTGGTTYFQPVNEALSRLGLTLVTTQPNPTVTLCSDNSYAGTCLYTSADQPNMSSTNVGNDTLSSVRVPAGRWLLLYLDYNYGGPCQSFTGDTPALSSTRIGNDRVSSYKIATSSPGSSCPAS